MSIYKMYASIILAIIGYVLVTLGINILLYNDIQSGIITLIIGSMILSLGYLGYKSNKDL